MEKTPSQSEARKTNFPTFFGAKAHANVRKGTFSTDCKSNCIRIGLKASGTAVLVLIVHFTSTADVTHAYQVYESTLHMYHMGLYCSARYSSISANSRLHVDGLCYTSFTTRIPGIRVNATYVSYVAALFCSEKDKVQQARRRGCVHTHCY